MDIRSIFSAIRIQELTNSILADKFKYNYGVYTKRVSKDDLSIIHSYIKRVK